MYTHSKLLGIVVATAAMSGLGWAGAAGASPQAPTPDTRPAVTVAGGVDHPTATTDERPFTYSIKDLPPSSLFDAHLRSGVVESAGGDADATTGTIRSVELLDNATKVSTGDVKASVDMTAWYTVNATSITGVPDLPTGATATLTNVDTGRTVTLANGVAFSIPTGLHPVTRGQLDRGARPR